MKVTMLRASLSKDAKTRLANSGELNVPLTPVDVSNIWLDNQPKYEKLLDVLATFKTKVDFEAILPGTIYSKHFPGKTIHDTVGFDELLIVYRGEIGVDWKKKDTRGANSLFGKKFKESILPKAGVDLFDIDKEHVIVMDYTEFKNLLKMNA